MAKQAAGSMLRSSIATTTIPTAFFVTIVEPSKESLSFQQTLALREGIFLEGLPELFSKLISQKSGIEESFKQRRNITF